MLVAGERIDVKPLDIAPQPERRPYPVGREVFVFVIVVSGQLSRVFARLVGRFEAFFALAEKSLAEAKETLALAIGVVNGDKGAFEKAIAIAMKQLEKTAERPS